MRAALLAVSLIYIASGQKPPATMLWAWEAPQQLEFLKPSDAGVAFLAASLYLQKDEVLIRPRMQPLHVDPGVFRMAVFRIDAAEHDKKPVFSDGQLKKVLDEVMGTSKKMGAEAVQIDFDARVSERAFYRKLLAQLRPQIKFLSMTALVSWCGDKSWIVDLPVDEVVPIIFGAGKEPGAGFSCARCRSSIGISIGDPLPKSAEVKRVYVFNGSSWSKAQAASVIRR